MVRVPRARYSPCDPGDLFEVRAVVPHKAWKSILFEPNNIEGLFLGSNLGRFHVAESTHLSLLVLSAG